MSCDLLRTNPYPQKVFQLPTAPTQPSAHFLNDLQLSIDQLFFLTDKLFGGQDQKLVAIIFADSMALLYHGRHMQGKLFQ